MNSIHETEESEKDTSSMISHDTKESSNSSSIKKSTLGEIVQFALIALVIVIPIRMFVAQPFIVSGASMESTFSTGQYLIIDQFTYHFNEPKRGDVVVFHYPKDHSTFFIKRIIGVPGDALVIDGNKVTITNPTHPNGVTLEEPYIKSMRPTTHTTENLGDGEYFVMGDNRDASSDSRVWGILERDKIVGRALVRLFPFTKIDAFPGAYDIDNGMKLLTP